MKVKWTLLIDDAKGGVDPKHYARLWDFIRHMLNLSKQ